MSENYEKKLSATLESYKKFNQKCSTLVENCEEAAQNLK
jgi:hypothetical protein